MCILDWVGVTCSVVTHKLSYYYIYYTNTFGKGMKSLIPTDTYYLYVEGM